MAKSKTKFVCSNCEATAPKWQGRCDNCQEWNTFVEEVVQPKTAVNQPRSSSRSKAVRLNKVETDSDFRIVVKNKEFNRVMGGGIVRDSVTIVTAPPGSGKSTLLLDISQELAGLGYVVYYASGEESVTQIKSRADRIIGTIHDNIWIKSETSINQIEADIQTINPDIIIIDSIQTMYAEEVNSRAGNPSQIDECTHRLIDIAKNPTRKRAIFIVGQMTKDDELAGNRTLEHAVDTVLYLEGDRTQSLRMLQAKKNRYGETGEVGLFSMEATGLKAIENPSEFFVTQRDVPVAGSALTVTREGSRNIVIEVESLVEKSMYGYPTRVGEGVNKQQLQILCGTIEKRGGISLSSRDVYVKVVAGLRPQETAVNLGVVMSIVSSCYGKGIETDTVFIGEVGLTGEIKTVPYLEARLKELDRLGFKLCYVPKNNLRQMPDLKQLKVIEVKTLDETISAVYGGEKLKKAN